MKSFFRKVANWFKMAVGAIRKFIKNSAGPAIKIVNAIKAVVDNPALDVLTALTATGIDDKALKHLRKALDTAITLLEVRITCANGTDLERLACLIDWLGSLPMEQRKAMYFKLASIIARLIDSTGMEKSRVDALVQLAYTESKIQDSETA